MVAVSIYGTHIVTIGLARKSNEQTDPGLCSRHVPLNVLDTSVNKSSTSPLAGVLEISTEDGVLHLAISGDAAKDLKIDLDQSLAQE